MEANIIRYQFNPPAVYQQGLGFRLFGKPITWRSVLKAAANKLIEVVAGEVNRITGYAFSDVIDEYKNKARTYVAQITGPPPASISQRTANPTLTVATGSEEDYLAAWADNQLKNFCAALIQQLAVLEDPNATQTAKIAALNLVAHKIDTVQDHFANYDFFDLSDEGVDSRSALLAIAFEPIYNVVKAYAEQLNLVTYASSFNPQGTGFAPLFPTTPLTAVPTEDFRARAGSITPSGGNTPNITPPAAGSSIGSGNSASGSGGSGTILGDTAPRSSAVGTNTAATIDAVAPKNNPLSTLIKNNQTSSNTGLYIGGGIAVAALIIAMTRNSSRPGLSGPKRRKYKRK